MQVSKPDFGWDYTTTTDSFGTVTGHYEDVNIFGIGSEIFYPADRINILSHITPARSVPLGAFAGSGGEIKLVGYNLRPEFGIVHSAQFLDDSVLRKGYWARLIKEFGLGGLQ